MVALRRVLGPRYLLPGILLVLVGSAVTLGWQYARPRQTLLRTVHEDSMAPTLHGAALGCPCPHCAAQVLFDPLGTPLDQLDVTCDTCGRNLIPLPLASLAPRSIACQEQPARHVRIRPRTGPWTSADRWNTVAYRHADGTLWVKRLVGLPGETLTLRNGDLWANGAILRKDWPQLRALAVPVLGRRWGRQLRVDRSRGLWGEVADQPERWGMIRRPVAGGMQYAFRSRELVGRRPDDGSILDDLTFNPTESRRLHAVADLYVTVHLAVDTGSRLRGMLTTSWRIGGSHWRARWDAERCRATLEQDGVPIETRQLPGPYAARKLTWEFAHCDRRFLVALDGVPVLTYVQPELAQAERLVATEPTITLTRQDANRLVAVQLCRDIHYVTATQRDDAAAPAFVPPTQPGLSTAERRANLPPESSETPPRIAAGAILLGDNPARSIDSRTLGRVALAQLVGDVEAVEEYPD